MTNDAMKAKESQTSERKGGHCTPPDDSPPPEMPGTRYIVGPNGCVFTGEHANAESLAYAQGLR